MSEQKDRTGALLGEVLRRRCTPLRMTEILLTRPLATRHPPPSAFRLPPSAFSVLDTPSPARVSCPTVSRPSNSPIFAARASLPYRLALGAVAVVMAVLPCIYVALTVLTAWATYLFASRYFLAIWQWPTGYNRGALMVKVLCSCTPVLTGGTAAFFMVKPLFARRPARTQPLTLTAQAEPRVHDLVRQICQAVGARAPQRIELSCDLNASAHLEPGWRGFFGNRLILTLGLPLVAGLTQRELAGVVAHEFGHFRQGGGMRVSALIRRVNHWFARVIYARDRWDVLIAQWAAGAGGSWMMLMTLWVQFGVGFARGVLWLLMKIGQTVSAALMRQMEYDADRCEIGLAGSAAFETAAVKFMVLGAVMEDVQLNMRRSWRAHFQLPDNLPVLVEYRAHRILPERRVRLENKAGLEKTGLLDTHPCTADRVRRARRLAQPGYDGLGDEPARDLFDSFDGLSRLVTLAHYQDNLNVPIAPDFLIPLEQLLRAEMDKTQAAAAPDAPAPAPARAKVPMMAYDPSGFQGKARP